MEVEKTFVMIKPDAVRRGLIGEIISTFERSGLSLYSMKMLRPTKDLVTRHYPDTTDWYSTVGKKCLDGYSLVGKDVKSELDTDDQVEIGKMVKRWLVDFLTSGNVVAMIWEGNSAVKNARRITGNTLPIMADPGSIRGRYSVDSPDIANAEKRPVHNLIHASGEIDEARDEIALWFPELHL
ncbi:MAG: nucleoside-diphosphate kinase [Dehalococcoidia bacterium]|nr:nucleoside-diphosphate kinase [Dehalococcoidia bacterium]